MRNYSICLVVALALLLGGGAYAQDYTWTGGGGDGMWNNPLNWDQFMVPDEYANNIFLGSATITIGPGEVQQPGLYTTFSTIFGPDWGGTLNIYGTLNYNWYLAPVQWDINNPSNVNLYGNAFISGEGVAVGYTWWYNGGPYANLNLYDNSYVDVNWVWWGGHINLFDGTLDIAAGVNDFPGPDGAVSDATRLMDIYDGTLILGWGDQTALVNNWISRGILKAFGGAGQIVIDTTSQPGKTIVTAIIPEPAGLAVLGTISLLGLRRRNK